MENQINAKTQKQLELETNLIMFLLVVEALYNPYLLN